MTRTKTKTRHKKPRRVPKIVSYLCKDPQQNRHRQHLMVHYGGWCYCVRCGFTDVFHRVDIYSNYPKAIAKPFTKTEILHIRNAQFDHQATLSSRFPSVQKLIDQRINREKFSGGYMEKSKIKRTIPKKLPKKIAKPLSDLKKAIKKDEKSLKKNPNVIPKALGKALVKSSKQLEKVKTKPLPKDTPKTKKCPKCGKIKAISQYGTRHVHGKTYLQSQCTSCRAG